MPAPPPESEPAMVRIHGGVGMANAPLMVRLSVKIFPVGKYGATIASLTPADKPHPVIVPGQGQAEHEERFGKRTPKQEGKTAFRDVAAFHAQLAERNIVAHRFQQASVASFSAGVPGLIGGMTSFASGAMRE